MATINQNNISEYIKQGLIDPSKIKIDLNKTKTTGDNVHRWVTLQSAIDSGYDFNFDYDVEEIQTPTPTPTLTTLPEVIVTTSKNLNQLQEKINPYITPEQIQKQKENESHWYDYADRNFKDTFGVSPREVADFAPIVGDILTLGDIKSSLSEGNYGEAALAGGMFILPNVIEKPLKKLWKYGKQTIRHLKSPLIDQQTYLRYGNAHLLDRYGDQLSKELINQRNKQIVNRINYEHSKNLKDVISKHNIIEKDGKYFLNGNELNPESIELLQKAPIYYDFALSSGLDPTSKNTVKMFINKQGSAVRGISVINPKDRENYLINLNPKVLNIAGDRFQSRNGLYVSNSNAIGIHYGNAKSPNSGREGFIGQVYHDYQIDPKLSVLQQLEELSKKDVLYDKFPNIKYKDTKLIPRGYRFPDAGVHSFSQNYKNYSRKTFNASEKVYFQPQVLKNISYIEDNTIGPIGNWYKYGVDPDWQYFSRFMVNSPEVIQNYFKIADKVIDKVPNSTTNQLLEQMQNRYNKVLKQRQKIKRNLYLGGVGIGSTLLGSGAYFTFNSSQENDQKAINQDGQINQDNIYNNWEKLK